METLRKRLDAVQEALLDIYETAENTLETQIKHWKLVRQEQTLLYFARQQGLSHIGLQTVPALQISESKAKEAIEIQLYLESLQNSKYGDEPWTMQETSALTFFAVPSRTFKKGPTTVVVQFEQHTQSYTTWTYLYIQTDTDMWTKYVGKVSNEGAYYSAGGGLKTFYISFSAEAKKYNTDNWTLVYKQLPVLTSSITPLQSPTGTTDTAETQPAGGRPKRRYGRRSESPRPRRRREDQEASSPGGVPVAPEDVGSRNRTVEAKRSSRLARLLDEARDPPIVVLKGNPNSLKCLRYRLRHQYSKEFQHISTTFQWVDTVDSARLGRGRMLVMFTDDAQRMHFLKHVPLPKHITAFKGQLDGI
ncbi:E2 [Morelia spilota papillomavirus 1]|uniref:Regulatory protein E2 n=1 Tax=Morelia spilota papillomavirus 1 TaxID=1081054 RepID=G3DRD3_9PAPI|nr:E2 [Morelia spilota papillomavirus 1]AEO16186.1 E2 [Morelia spilota papillomavirus 1]